MTERNPNISRLRRVGAAVALLTCTLVALPARAHFTLDAPPTWMSQDFLGSPQKLGPCGDEAGGMSTGTVTAFQQGDTITVTIDEKIFHPGHYRIALAIHDRSELPAEPVVTPAGTPCGSVEIQSPPIFPVLADGVWPHTAPFSGPQTVQVKLPADVTCTNCTLQVIEFMSNHPLNNPGGCFYHHCADIAIAAPVGPDGGGGGAASSSTSTSGSTSSGAVTTGTGGATAAGGAGGEGGSNTPSSTGGCGCSTQGGSGSALAGLAGLLVLATRRRRRAPAAAR
jgi:MYXO-CTERM domain-containing protein